MVNVVIASGKPLLNYAVAGGGGGVGVTPQGADHLPLPLRIAKTGRNHLNEEFTPLLPTGIGERF
jgi:hypothetical protein